MIASVQPGHGKATAGGRGEGVGGVRDVCLCCSATHSAHGVCREPCRTVYYGAAHVPSLRPFVACSAGVGTTQLQLGQLDFE
jgi:hypothetical protein